MRKIRHYSSIALIRFKQYFIVETDQGMGLKGKVFILDLSLHAFMHGTVFVEHPLREVD